MIAILSAIVSILSFGAVADGGVTDNAAAINRAISHCAAQGGGVVTVPAGVFGTGSIYMRSHVRLRLDEGATLLGSPRVDDYAPLHTGKNLSRYESGAGSVNYNSATDPEWSRALIFCVGVEHAAIEGPGRIDGGNVRNPKGEEHMRGPHTILMVDCEDMALRDFTIERSANYAILGYEVEDTRFTGITVHGGWDGIHLRGAEDVTIERCQLHTGDDAIAGGYWEDVQIRHCTLNSSCNGIRMIMPSEQVTVSDCHIYGPGLYPHQTSGNKASLAAINIEPGAWGKAPGSLDDLVIRRVRVETVLTPLSVTLGDDNSLGTLLVEKLTARDITRMALSVKSWGTARTERVVLRDCDMEFRGTDDPALPAWFRTHPTSEWPVFPCWGAYFRNVDQVDAHGLRLTVKGRDYRPATMTDGVTSVRGL